MIVVYSFLVLTLILTLVFIIKSIRELGREISRMSDRINSLGKRIYDLENVSSNYPDDAVMYTDNKGNKWKHNEFIF